MQQAVSVIRSSLDSGAEYRPRSLLGGQPPAGAPQNWNQPSPQAQTAPSPQPYGYGYPQPGGQPPYPPPPPGYGSPVPAGYPAQGQGPRQGAPMGPHPGHTPYSSGQPEHTARRQWWRDEVSTLRVIAAGGGILTLFGVGFLVNIAISNGWFGPGARVATAYLLAAVMLFIAVRHYRSTSTATGAVTALVATSAGTACVTTLALYSPLGWMPSYLAAVLILLLSAAYVWLSHWMRTELAVVLLSTVSALCLIFLASEGVSSGDSIFVPVLLLAVMVYGVAWLRGWSKARVASALIGMFGIYADLNAVLLLMDERGFGPGVLLLYTAAAYAWLCLAGIHAARHLAQTATQQGERADAAAAEQLRRSVLSHLLVVLLVGLTIAGNSPALYPLLLILPVAIVSGYAAYTAHGLGSITTNTGDLGGGWGLLAPLPPAPRQHAQGHRRSYSLNEAALLFARGYYALFQLLLPLAAVVAWFAADFSAAHAELFGLVFLAVSMILVWAAVRVATLVPMSASGRAQLWVGWLIAIQLIMLSQTLTVMTLLGTAYTRLGEQPPLFVVLTTLGVLGAFHVPSLLRGLSTRSYVLGGVLTLSLSLTLIVLAVTRATATLAPSMISAAFFTSHAVASVCWMVASALIILGKTPIARDYEFPVGLLLALAATVKVVFFDLTTLDSVARTITFLGCGLVLLVVAIIRSRTISPSATDTTGTVAAPHQAQGPAAAQPAMAATDTRPQHPDPGAGR
ncbi:DUF2339 domain-containing protein [Corynebacterium sp. TAE3-ERU30]|uniref:DUF2339 domain-containing protein n=1 Tax=Corynebacterium sp. TAE3-ERU30 TaxID=2849496 RepID=UPI001C45CB37|nr:DUF2339 domain-containing protein [Corynebacterium sp. TAE3-ERU30]MBV7281411.1 DUF2339 domain-containing protein [Corynebacterium sp. TAE3-ERU30]